MKSTFVVRVRSLKEVGHNVCQVRASSSPGPSEGALADQHATSIFFEMEVGGSRFGTTEAPPPIGQELLITVEDYQQPLIIETTPSIIEGKTPK